MSKYDKMIEENQRKSKEKIELAVQAIQDMLANKERISVPKLMKKTGLSRGFFYKNPTVRDTLNQAVEQQAGMIDPKCIYLSGYTEYHASQVELMVLLGENNIRPNKFTFSLDFEIFHKKTVKDYLLQKHQLFVDMMNGKAVTMNAEKLITTLGVLYNYWGLCSVCKMYGQNYIEQIDNTPIIKEFPERMFFVADTFMEGWFDKKKVEQSFGLYSNILMPMLKK